MKYMKKRNEKEEVIETSIMLGFTRHSLSDLFSDLLRCGTDYKNQSTERKRF